MKRGHNQDENLVAEALQDLSKRFSQAFEPQESIENIYNEMHEINRSLDYMCNKTDIMVATFVDIRDLICSYIMSSDEVFNRYHEIKRQTRTGDKSGDIFYPRSCGDEEEEEQDE